MCFTLLLPACRIDAGILAALLPAHFLTNDAPLRRPVRPFSTLRALLALLALTIVFFYFFLLAGER